MEAQNMRGYFLKISSLTIDKLGVKLYDRASAVVAELIANSFDADAETVHVRLPLATLLGKKTGDGTYEDRGHVIEVIDDGHGMTPEEAQDFFLKVGRDRRVNPGQGARSRLKNRPVMGRKGIGKLAPFGICRRIEIISAGGERTEDGYVVSNFVMDFERLMVDTDQPIELDRGELDRTFKDCSGTVVRLSHFINKRVPPGETFLRQLSARFGLSQDDFRIIVEDTRDPDQAPSQVDAVHIPVVDETRIDLSTHPVPLEDGSQLDVKGWMALAKQSYKHEELAGVRIYARGKIVATTRDFEQPAGFTGEFTMRSYLVGEIYADWLDLDDGEDLIRTDRQGILWESDYGRALRAWGADLIKEIAGRYREPRRLKVSAMFLERSRFKEKAESRFRDSSVIDTAMQLAKRIGAFAAEDELEDDQYVNDLAEVVLSVAPHKALIEAFREFNSTLGEGEVSLDRLMDLFEKTRIAEMASYAQIATERVEAVIRLETVIVGRADECVLQQLIEDAPWLIDPTWVVITKNQALNTFVRAFQRFWRERTGDEVTFGISDGSSRPDFIAVDIGHVLHIVEIKAIGHTFNDSDFQRLVKYVTAFQDFFQANREIRGAFSRGWQVDLVADKVNLNESAHRVAYESLTNDKRVITTTWEDFLYRARRAHELFLEARDRAHEEARD